MNPARIPIGAASESAWPVSRKDIPRRRIAWSKWIISKRKSTPAPTTSSRSSSSIIATSYDFRERCALAGIHVPIIAGIMPITSMSGFKRIAELAGGARFPAKLLRALQRCENDREDGRAASAFTSPSNNATISWTTTSPAFTSTPSIAPTRRGQSSTASAFRVSAIRRCRSFNVVPWDCETSADFPNSALSASYLRFC